MVPPARRLAVKELNLQFHLRAFATTFSPAVARGGRVRM